MAITPEKLDKTAPMQAQPQMEVLDTIKKSKGEGKSKKMGSVDIIREAYMREADPSGFDMFLKKLYTLIQNPNAILVQFGNTVFLMLMLDRSTVETKIFTTDTPDNVAKAVVDAANLLKADGFKKAISASTLPGFVDIAKKTGLPVKISQGQAMMGNEAKPSYIFELDL